MKIKLIVKEKNNHKYRVLVVELGYRRYLIEYADYKIAEILSCPVANLYGLDLGEYDVGSIYGLKK